MYNNGEIVTLNTDKSEGAGDNSLYVGAGITGMIVNAGRGCGGNGYAYVVDFGPEGQWNCVHSELDRVGGNAYEEEEEEEGWDENNEEELRQDITEEQASAIYGDESRRPGYGDFRVESAEPPSPISFERDMVQAIDPKKKNKKISFEEDLARIAAEAERNAS